tara:strand:- start:1681 stop:2145 length:465 start_codon:yes stop_codon:yes gene_type:complete
MDDEDVTVPDGMMDVHTALESLHIISNMIVDPRVRGGHEILERLKLLGFSDETSFYLLWYVLCVSYHELESVTDQAYTVMSLLDIPIEQLLVDDEKQHPSLSEAVRTLLFNEEDIAFGELRPSWKQHFKARYKKYWRKYLDHHPRSVPYYEKEK